MNWLSATWAQVWPNLIASALWATPAFTTHHLLMKRHINQRHQETRDHITAGHGR